MNDLWTITTTITTPAPYNWRGTWHYSNSDLIEYLRIMRRNDPLSVSATYLLRREVLLQANERGLIRLPEGFIAGDVHTIPFSEVIILNEEINKDQT